MKRTFLFLLLACFSLIGPALAAPHVTDNANLLSNRAAQLSSEIGDSPVWIETFVALPSGGDLKTYTDQRLQSIGHQRSFLIVLTTQPRAWRISMYPVGFVGAEVAKGVGDQMAGGLKSGDIYGALSKASRTLAGVAKGTTVVKANPDGSVKTVTTTTNTSVVTTKKVVSAAPRAATVVVQQAPADYTWVWWTLIVFGLIALIFVLAYLYDRRADRLAREAQQEHDEKMAAIEARNRRETSSSGINQSSLPPYIPPSPSTATFEQRQQAQQSWDSYTPTQRQTVVNQYSSSPYYHGGVLSDPFSFWMFMTMVNGGFGNNHGYGYGGGGGMYSPPAAPVYVTPPEPPTYVEEQRVERTTTTRTEETYTPAPAPSYYSPPVERDSRSSSDDSGSSSSWSDSSSSSSSSDSSSSSSSDSSSSSSSSDSGGSSGDW